MSMLACLVIFFLEGLRVSDDTTPFCSPSKSVTMINRMLLLVKLAMDILLNILAMSSSSEIEKVGSFGDEFQWLSEEESVHSRT